MLMGKADSHAPSTASRVVSAFLICVVALIRFVPQSSGLNVTDAFNSSVLISQQKTIDDVIRTTATTVLGANHHRS